MREASWTTTAVGLFQDCEICFCKREIVRAGPPVWSTYTVLDVEVSAVHNQESDHLVTIQPHGVVQGGIAFLERQSEQAKRGPGARTCVQNIEEWS